MTDLARFTLRTEADLLALVPHTLGFHPVDSLVVVALDAGGRPLCARVDLPDELAGLPLVLEQLLVAALRHDARTALVVAYCADEALAEVCAGVLVDALEDEDVRVVCGIRADGERWWPLAALRPDPDDPLTAAGERYDVRAHPFTSAAVVEGHVTLASRDELARTLEPDEALVAPVQEACRVLGRLPARHSRLVREGAWLRRTVATLAGGRRGHLAEAGHDWDARSAARVLRDLRHPDLRDLVWCDLTRARADAHTEVWRSLLRRTPERSEDQVRAPVAAVLAFSAWLGGHGALAWCAVEQAWDDEPGNVLAGLVAHALEQAIPPATWTPFDLASLRLSE